MASRHEVAVYNAVSKCTYNIIFLATPFYVILLRILALSIGHVFNIYIHKYYEPPSFYYILGVFVNTITLSYCSETANVYVSFLPE